jgi:type IV pilus assembly protein PilV
MFDRRFAQKEAGASLVEVLVSVLILSFGMLSLSSMMAFAVQLPKLSGYRATAANIASTHVEKIRANPQGFQGGEYSTASSYDGTFNEITLQSCLFPHCSVSSLALMDDAATKRAARVALPAGGILTTCDPHPCTENSLGNVWVMWQEPNARAVIDAASSDNCPPAAAVFTDPTPRCLYVRFKP